MKHNHYHRHHHRRRRRLRRHYHQCFVAEVIVVVDLQEVVEAATEATGRR